jgi:hypothetical protein
VALYKTGIIRQALNCAAEAKARCRRHVAARTEAYTIVHIVHQGSYELLPEMRGRWSIPVDAGDWHETASACAFPFSSVAQDFGGHDSSEERTGAVQSAATYEEYFP